MTTFSAPTILVFDSGLGGLTVHREVARARPDARFIYAADDAFFPYGRQDETRLVDRVVVVLGELIAAHRRTFFSHSGFRCFPTPPTSGRSQRSRPAGGRSGTKSPSRDYIQVAAPAPRYREEFIMLGWAVTFLLVALVAAVLGFGGIATFAVDIAKIIFFVAIVLFVVSAVIALVRGRSPTTMP